MTTSPAIMEVMDLGLMPYREAWALQERLRGERVAGRIADRLLLVEHPSVFTMGKRDCANDFFSTPEQIAADGIEIVKTNRGGRVTWHGPGQQVAYFICELAGFGMGIREFVFAVEELCIRLLARLGVDGTRDPDHPGIWVGRNKIVAIGMNVQHCVTEHGLALNVEGNLAAYRHILACGIRDRGVTTVARAAGKAPSMDDVKRGLVAGVGELFGRTMVSVGDGYAEVKVGSSTCGVSSSAGGSS